MVCGLWQHRQKSNNQPKCEVLIQASMQYVDKVVSLYATKVMWSTLFETLIAKLPSEQRLAQNQSTKAAICNQTRSMYSRGTRPIVSVRTLCVHTE